MGGLAPNDENVFALTPLKFQTHIIIHVSTIKL